jgi:uncharacterized membrane protein YoaK (UPF0700 family)
MKIQGTITPDDYVRALKLANRRSNLRTAIFLALVIAVALGAFFVKAGPNSFDSKALLSFAPLLLIVALLPLKFFYMDPRNQKK